ncbi:hypothetical protein GCM10027162_18150 [Streptomyces incanus]
MLTPPPLSRAQHQPAPDDQQPGPRETRNTEPLPEEQRPDAGSRDDRGLPQGGERGEGGAGLDQQDEGVRGDGKGGAEESGAACWRSSAAVSPRRFRSAYAGITVPWTAVNQATQPGEEPKARTPRASTTVCLRREVPAPPKR